VLLGLLVMAGVFAIALVPAMRHLTAVSLVIPEGDKLLHAGAFAALMLGWGNVYRSGRGRSWIAASCLLFGVLIELAQWPRSPEDADGFDLLADAIGLALGGLLLRTPLAAVLASGESWLVRRRGR
jgi:VanZ family protein